MYQDELNKIETAYNEETQKSEKLEEKIHTIKHKYKMKKKEVEEIER